MQEAPNGAEKIFKGSFYKLSAPNGAKALDKP